MPPRATCPNDVISTKAKMLIILKQLTESSRSNNSNMGAWLNSCSRFTSASLGSRISECTAWCREPGFRKRDRGPKLPAGCREFYPTCKASVRSRWADAEIVSKRVRPVCPKVAAAPPEILSFQSVVKGWKTAFLLSKVFLKTFGATKKVLRKEVLQKKGPKVFKNGT